MPKQALNEKLLQKVTKTNVTIWEVIWEVQEWTVAFDMEEKVRISTKYLQVFAVEQYSLKQNKKQNKTDV